MDAFGKLKSCICEIMLEALKVTPCICVFMYAQYDDRTYLGRSV